jgi:hypothetical protein
MMVVLSDDDRGVIRSSVILQIKQNKAKLRIADKEKTRLTALLNEIGAAVAANKKAYDATQRTKKAQVVGHMPSHSRLWHNKHVGLQRKVRNQSLCSMRKRAYDATQRTKSALVVGHMPPCGFDQTNTLMLADEG